MNHAESYRFVIGFVAVLSIATGSPSTLQGEVVTQRVGLTFHSDDQSILLTSDFPGGRMSDCTQLGEDEFAITIQPEIERVNDSAWYAFRIESEQHRTVSIHMNYVGGSHRYRPKISHDGRNWEQADHLLTRRHPLGSEVVLEIPVDGRPLWVAGQELLSCDHVDRWTHRLAEERFVSKSIIGESVQGRPLYRLDITETGAPNYVFIMARQHPPEVSGAIGMMDFVEAITDQSSLAHDFRSRYSTIVVPTANPDGVAHGNWRCNANGIDLNRDWAHFTQPETRVISDQLLACRTETDGQLCLFIDFHSTFEDVFYIPSRKSILFPSGFTDDWFAGIQQRFPNYPVKVDDTHNTHRTTSKAWVSEILGVSAITYEFGDETDRETIRKIAGGAAEEMMRLLLQLPEAISSDLVLN